MKKLVERVKSAAKTTAKGGDSKSRAKRAGDVIGISDARVKSAAPKSPAGAATKRSARPKGIEVGTKARGTAMRPARTVGGVRGRGR
ncbi:MAG: hypothetical protein KBA95_07640 [Acidobacteria bacterium]|nr:hypothetical protein [Acidobacteriota bacterium]